MLNSCYLWRKQYQTAQNYLYNGSFGQFYNVVN